MAGKSGNGNPFRPGTGNPPPFLAGRDAEIALARRRLAELAGETPPAQGVLCYGPRGNGKTAVLRRVATEARERGLRVDELPVDTLRDRERITTELQERSGHAGSRLTGVHVGPLGASTDPPLRSRNLFRLFTAWVNVSPAPLVILLDEVQRIVPEVGGAFFDAVQQGAATSLPFVVFAAGTPSAPSRLQCATYLERAFECRRIGRLTREAVIAALAEPASAAGRPMSSGAQQRLREASQDYPYFIQLLGSAAWDAAREAEDPVISETAARKGIERALPLIVDFYAERYAEARERRVHRLLLPLARLIADQGGTLSEGELDEFLDRTSSGGDAMEPRALLGTLQELGIVWQSAVGVWEMGIPSFGRYLLDGAAHS